MTRAAQLNAVFATGFTTRFAVESALMLEPGKHFMYYNFCRKHQTLTQDAGGVHTTPAMAAGVSDHVWKLGEIVAMLPV